MVVYCVVGTTLSRGEECSAAEALPRFTPNAPTPPVASPSSAYLVRIVLTGAMAVLVSSPRSLRKARRLGRATSRTDDASTAPIRVSG